MTRYKANIETLETLCLFKIHCSRCRLCAKVPEVQEESILASGMQKYNRHRCQTLPACDLLTLISLIL